MEGNAVEILLIDLTVEETRQACDTLHRENLGNIVRVVTDAASAARHLAATSVTSAGSAVPEAQSASGAQFETSDASRMASVKTARSS